MGRAIKCNLIVRASRSLRHLERRFEPIRGLRFYRPRRVFVRKQRRRSILSEKIHRDSDDPQIRRREKARTRASDSVVALYAPRASFPTRKEFPPWKLSFAKEENARRAAKFVPL